MKKIVVCIMGQDNKDLLEICLKSVEGTDAIVYCDGGSRKDFMQYLYKQDFVHSHNLRPGAIDQKRCLIQQDFDQEDPYMNGKQRNFYLDFLKRHYAGWWCLCLDVDEVVEDFAKLREWINSSDDNLTKDYLFNPHMRHLVYNWRFEDATKEKHYVPHRLFIVRATLEYPLGEHTPLINKEPFTSCNLDGVTIWHLAYADMLHVKKRYEKNLKHSAVHTKDFLDQWYKAHLFGQYPVKQLDIKELPKVLLEGYGIDKDEFYFKNRDLELKHFFMVLQWNNLLGTNASTILDLGCGRGPYLAAWLALGKKALGIELSRWAKEHPVVSVPSEAIMQGDITVKYYPPKSYDIVTMIDVLEHLTPAQLDLAINNAMTAAKQYLIISVPVIGDPNLYNDTTHKIFETKEWWTEQFTTRGLKQIPVPEDFYYHQQLLFFEVQ